MKALKYACKNFDIDSGYNVNGERWGIFYLYFNQTTGEKTIRIMLPYSIQTEWFFHQKFRNFNCLLNII